MKKIWKKNHILMIIINILLAILLIIGISFAYWIITHLHTEKNINSNICFTTSFIKDNDINLDDQFMMTDSDGAKLTPYTFTITNTCSVAIEYQVNMEVLNTTTADLSYIRTKLNDEPSVILKRYATVAPTMDDVSSSYKLTSDYIEAGEQLTYNLRLWINQDANDDIQNKTFSAKVAIIIIGSKGNVEKKSLVSTILENAGGKEAIEGKIKPDFSSRAPKFPEYKDNGFSTDEFSEEFTPTVQGYYITYADSYTFDSATGLYSLTNPITAKYSDVYTILEGKYLALDNTFYEPYTESSNGFQNSTISNIIKCVKAPYSTTENVNFIMNYLTSPTNNEEDIASYDASSSGMWSAPDDYGTSYYYRGAVTNNNVLFGGFCWKVIRINGNGTTRMIYNGSPSSGQCIATKGDTQISTSAFNTNYNDNAYVGYMYGTAGSSTYDATHANTNSSTIKTVIDNWYNTNLSSYADKISDTEFCNDRSMASAATTWYSSDTALGYGTNKTFYGAYNRLINNNAPILTCPNQHDRFTVDDTGVGNGDLTYPVSLITIDEVAVAGGSLEMLNRAYYLYTGSYYWTTSPDIVDSMSAFEYIVSCDGYLAHSIVDNTYIGVRPVINLNANIHFIAGDGTSKNPFVIS